MIEIGSFKALLLDFNGVIVDDESLHLKLFSVILKDHGVYLDDAVYFTRCVGLCDRDVFTFLNEFYSLGWDKRYINFLVRKKNTLYYEFFERNGFPIVPSVIELIRDAKKEKIKVGIVSGALKSEIISVLKVAGVRDLVDVIVAAEDVKKGKPHPEGYLYALERLKLCGEGCVVLEDSQAGVDAAKAAGCFVVGVMRGYNNLKNSDTVIFDIEKIDLNLLRKLYINWKSLDKVEKFK